MESRIKKMYIQDFSLVIVFLVVLWITLIYIMISILSILTTPFAVASILITGLLVGLSASLTLFALIKHLKKNKNALYMEEIKYSK